MTNVTTIQLLGGIQGYLDTSENIAIPLNFSISEIRDVTKKKGSFSKSIILPATKNNNQLLNYYFDVNIQAGTFNINKLQYCSIIQNGINILDNALIQLVSINKTQTNNNNEDKITYTVLIKDKASDFFTSISNKYLTDLTGFEWMNHQYTAANVISSFDNTISDGYKYVMPFNAESADDAVFNLNEFYPAVYAKIYFDKIFNAAGYSYSWPEASGSTVNFDKLIIPYNGDAAKSVKEVNPPLNVQATRTTALNTMTIYKTNTNWAQGNSPQLIGCNNEINDPSNSLSVGGNIYTVPNVGGSANQLKIKYTYDYNLNKTGAGSTTQTGNLKVIPRFILRGALPGQPATVLYTDTARATQITVVPPAPIYTYNSGTAEINITIPMPAAGTQVYLTADMTREFGDTNTLLNTTFNFSMSNFKIDLDVLVDGDVGYNVPIKIDRFVPQKVLQSDFIKSIFTAFNIYAEVDRVNLNQINLISRDKYYDTGKIEDWSKKLCKDKPQELKFIPELNNKKLILSYKPDTDFANKTYTTSTKEIYGQIEYTFDNEYVKDTNKQELIFSPTPVTNTSFGAICPMWVGSAPKNNIRLLYDGGALPTTAQYTINNFLVSPGVYNFAVATTYPHISHWNKPVNPTFDLNFGVCDFYFRSDDYGSDTNNNLFNLHWRRTLNQINSGKLLLAYFTLTEYDIFKMRLNDKIKIDNSWWNINKIIDYDASGSKITKVELISADQDLYIPYIKKTPYILTPNSPLLTGKNALAKDRNNYINNILSTGDVTVKGMNNYISNNVNNANIIGNNNNVGYDGIVVGSNNFVDSKASVFGNNNFVESGLENVFVLGDSVSATTGNTIFVPNIQMPSGGTINNVSVSQIITAAGSTLFAPGTGTESVIQINTLFPNQASGNYAHVEGKNNAAFNTSAHAEGSNNAAFGTSSHVEGDNTAAFAANSHAEGSFSQANGMNSHAGGYGAITNRSGEFARSTQGPGNGLSRYGQYGTVDFKGLTTGTALTELYIGDISGERYYINGNNEAHKLKITAIAINVATGASKEWERTMLVKNVGSTITTVGTPTTTTTGDAAMAGTNFTAYPDNPNNSIFIEATGLAATNISWYVKLDYVKVA